MSIIIRLQNLPVNAKTGDVRKFFGGLRIPDGGVHILGGDKGDAFIAFMSDEDARLAMRKDGGRIKDSRIKLFLSSRMEMQHEVEKITKGNLDFSLSEDKTPGSDNIKNRSYEKRRRSRSPRFYDDWNFEKNRSLPDYQRSKSPTTHTVKKLSPVRFRSRSPRRRSRSPKLPVKSKSSVPKGKPISPKMHNFQSLSVDDDTSHFLQKDSRSLSQSERQAELERRITEEIEKNILYKKALREEENDRLLELQQQHPSLMTEPENLMFLPDNSNMHHIEDTGFKHNSIIRKEKLPFGAFPDSNKEKQQTDCFYVTLEGMDLNWGFREVQLILRGHYAPQHNIRMEMDNTGFKTGRAFVKLTNKDDFDNILQKPNFFFKNRKVFVKACPLYIAQNYFQPDSDFTGDNNFPQTRNLCYLLKGLPFTCTYDDVIAFFHGFEISDLIICYGDKGQATGTGYVTFKTWKDFEGAFSQNGKKIGHRYIEMLSCTEKEVAEAKTPQHRGNFIPYSQILSEKRLPTFRRPICALLTGLPFYVSIKKILAFFAESGLKPDAIHITMSTRKQSDGRAFVEFSNYLDFDLALKFHGKKLDNHTVCVKQILYDEMVKILDSQKAKHYFGISDPAASASTVEPEKVPYLWEPPDGKYDKEFHFKDNRPSVKLQGQSSFPYNKNVSGNFHPNTIPGRNFYPGYNQHSPEMGSLHPIYPGNSGLGAYDMKYDTGNIMYNSVPYDSNEFIPHLDDYSTKKYEENIKSSRLSPENEAALLDFLNRDRKSFADKSNRRSRSVERRNKKYFKAKPKDSFRIKNEKESRYHESAALSNPLHFNDNKGIHNDECIVQLSNVDVSVGTRDLIDFLKGFDFIEDTLIRRYTSENMPTSDVRVTFSDKSEAESAIRLLNKRFLHGKAVNMFII